MARWGRFFGIPDRPSNRTTLRHWPLAVPSFTDQIGCRPRLSLCRTSTKASSNATRRSTSPSGLRSTAAIRSASQGPAVTTASAFASSSRPLERAPGLAPRRPCPRQKKQHPAPSVRPFKHRRATAPNQHTRVRAHGGARRANRRTCQWRAHAIEDTAHIIQGLGICFNRYVPSTFFQTMPSAPRRYTQANAVGPSSSMCSNRLVEVRRCRGQPRYRKSGRWRLSPDASVGGSTLRKSLVLTPCDHDLVRKVCNFSRSSSKVEAASGARERQARVQEQIFSQ